MTLASPFVLTHTKRPRPAKSAARPSHGARKITKPTSLLDHNPTTVHLLKELRSILRESYRTVIGGACLHKNYTTTTIPVPRTPARTATPRTSRKESRTTASVAGSRHQAVDDIICVPIEIDWSDAAAEVWDVQIDV